MHPMTFTDACWMFMETKQWMLAQWGSGWRVSAVATAMWKTSHVPDGHAQLSHHEMKSVSNSSSAPIGGLRLGNCVLSWLSCRLEFPESGQRGRQPFSCNMTMPGPISVWRPWSTLPVLGGLSYHTHRIVRIWPLLTSICLGRWKMDCGDNIFLATTPSYELWNSGPPPLVQIFTSAAHRLLFIVGESA